MRYRRVLGFRPTRVIPVFIFASNQDFSAGNITPGLLDEGVGGFTDFYRGRVVVPFNGDEAALRHVLAHEIVHAFQFQILPGPGYGRYPLWIMEGLSEYLALGWDASAEAYARDLVLHERMPSLLQLQRGEVASSYAYYKGGQAAMMFLAETYGEERLGYFLRELGALDDVEAAVSSSFGRSLADLDVEFRRFMQARYAPARAALREDPRLRRASDRYAERSGFFLRPALSPDGTQIAFLGRSGLFPAVIVRPAPASDVDGERMRERVIELRALRSLRYEEFQPLTTRISFSPDGKRLLVAGRAWGEQALIVIDMERAAIVATYAPDLDALQFPIFSPDGTRALFTGVRAGQADLYTYEFSSGALVQLTDSPEYEAEASYARDGRQIYFAAGLVADDPGRQLFRLASDGAAGSRVQLTDLPGAVADPRPAREGGVVFSTDFSGVRNVYRLNDAEGRTAPARAAELMPLTASAVGVLHAELSLAPNDGAERLLFTEREEGALEMRLLTAGLAVETSPTDPLRVSAVAPSAETTRTFDPAQYRMPTRGVELETSLAIENPNAPYEPRAGIEGFPFILIGGSSANGGEARFTALAAGSLADDLGDHRVSGLVGYSNPPPEWTLDARYAYTKFRTDFFLGAYRQKGAFPVASLFDLSLNNLLYNPYARILDQDVYGFYAGAEHPLGRFMSLRLAYDQGREERFFRGEEPEEREQADIFRNFQNVALGLAYNNLVYSAYGPLDGQSLLVSYTVPIRTSADDRELYTTIVEYRLYHWFENQSLLALRIFGGAARGEHAYDYPFRIGGYNTVRGYDFQEFEGVNAAFVNLEYRFALIEPFGFAVPTHWSPGALRGALFFDAGAAFDEARSFQGYTSQSGTTRDLHLSYGAGLHWPNFLGFVIPGATMKIEWATPYDLKRSLPPKKWRGAFSIGFNF